MATKMLVISISFIGQFIRTFKAGNIISAIGNSVKSLLERVIPLHLVAVHAKPQLTDIAKRVDRQPHT